MHIWVDADACPVVIKEIIFKAAQRTSTAVTLVANRPVSIPRSPFISFRQVAAGPDVADQEIVASLTAGDLVVTADIPLAAAAIKKGGTALDPRGDLYTETNIHDKLSSRDLMDMLRSTGLEIGGPPALNKKDRQNFANSLDRILTRHGR